ncbi:MAG: aldehyde dehydrogenase family protein [Sphingomonadales bacterium]|nr:aldehyde dehydrogenase family protein [Sphingomonadales bacterium]MBU3993296.1 aldehyde dehydrogenase family protein [Alphaproteobacteria bacterium]
MAQFPTSPLYIDGKLRPAEGGRVYDVETPVNGTVVGQAADATTADVDEAIAAARRAFDETDWSTNVPARAAALRRWQDALRELADTYRPRVMAETGCTRLLTHMVQMDTPVEMMTWTINLAETYDWQRDIGVSNVFGLNSRRLVVKEPSGVVGAITPWNVPVQCSLAKSCAALAAGCTVVLKMAPDTPWSGAYLAEAAAKAGLPAGVFNVITSSEKAAPGEQIVADPRVDVISFTGSTAVGKRIMEAGAPTLKRVFLELGGKSANIVLDDAVFPEALESGLAVCMHAGQGCSITTRLLVPRSRYDEAVAILEQMFKAVPFGDPEAMDQIMGPVVSKAQYDRVLNYIEVGKQEGARLVAGGAPAFTERGGYYIQPTLFADVDNAMRIAQEEIFGPVLAVIPFDDDDDAVRIANDSKYGLSGAVQSSNPDRAMAVAKRIRSGTMAINKSVYFGSDAPFGGYKQSGIGREMGLEGFEEYLQTKTIALEAEPA